MRPINSVNRRGNQLPAEQIDHNTTTNIKIIHPSNILNYYQNRECLNLLETESIFTYLQDLELELNINLQLEVNGAANSSDSLFDSLAQALNDIYNTNLYTVEYIQHKYFNCFSKQYSKKSENKSLSTYKTEISELSL